MPSPVSWQRIYPTEAGLEHPATEASVSNVLRSMRESAGGILPFKVLIRMDDQSVVIVKPKRAK